VWLAGLVVAVLVSPKVQLNVFVPTPLVVVAVNVTGDVASGDAGVKVKVTPSAAATTTLWVEVALTPFASVAVTVTLKVPPAV
jgi:hypothetical protein